MNILHGIDLTPEKVLLWEQKISKDNNRKTNKGLCLKYRVHHLKKSNTG